jgi:hypothetical protein
MRLSAMSSIVGIGAVLSAVVLLVVFWFLALAAVQDTRRGYIEPDRPTRSETRRDKRLNRQLAFRDRAIERADAEVEAAARPAGEHADVDALTWSALTRAKSSQTDV